MVTVIATWSHGLQNAVRLQAGDAASPRANGDECREITRNGRTDGRLPPYEAAAMALTVLASAMPTNGRQAESLARALPAHVCEPISATTSSSLLSNPFGRSVGRVGAAP